MPDENDELSKELVEATDRTVSLLYTFFKSLEEVELAGGCPICLASQCCETIMNQAAAIHQGPCVTMDDIERDKPSGPSGFN
jgi:hypothetical protein